MTGIVGGIVGGLALTVHVAPFSSRISECDVATTQDIYVEV